MSKNITTLSERKGLDKNLFEEIANRAYVNGQLDNKALTEIAKEFLIGDANILGALTAYDFLNPDSSGKKAYVCSGTACMLAMTQDKVKATLGSALKSEEIGEMVCLGRCHENAAFHYRGSNYSGLSTDQINSLLGGGPVEPFDNYFVQSAGAAILTSEEPSLDSCLDAMFNLLDRNPDELMAMLEQSNLRGRGGAGFPIHLKLRTVKEQSENTKFIVCNADEGDPGAFSDRYLLEQKPHLVLSGMILSGFICGATSGIVYLRAEYPEAIEIVQRSINLFNGHFPYTNSHGQKIHFQLKLIKAQGAYICGEETALLNSIEGNRPEVRVRPPYPVTEGLYNKPTLLNNVETLANLYFILAIGHEHFTKIGTKKSKGTKLLSLDSFFVRPGLYEIEMGTPLHKVIYELAGGFKTPVKAVHIGGPLGGIVPAEKISHLTVDFESFSDNGFLLGHASLVCIPKDYPLVKYLYHLFAFTAHESCGKCFPCRIGSVRGAELLKAAENNGKLIDEALFQDLLFTLEQGSLCGLGGGLPLPVRNVMEHFKNEMSTYFINRNISE